MDTQMLDKKQLKILNDFNEAICSEGGDYNDRQSLKWLIARDFDLEKALDMYKKSMRWRLAIGADSILENWKAPEVLQKYVGPFFVGYTKSGYPIWLDMSCSSLYNGIFHCVSKTDFIKHRVQKVEDMIRRYKVQSEKLGKCIDQSVAIVDTREMSLMSFSDEYLSAQKMLVRTFNANYPENIKSVYVINAPSILPIVYNILSPVLPARTKEKIKILGGDFLPTLLEDIDKDQIPEHLGGTNSEFIERVPEWVINGELELPKSYYRNNESNVYNEPEKTGFSHKTVNMGEYHKVQIDVQHDMATLRWEFFTKDNDIGFGVFRLKKPGKLKLLEMEEIIPCMRANSHQVSQDGMMICEKAGTYVLVFDNTYSWLKNKELYFLVKVSSEEITKEFEAETKDVEILEKTSL